MEPSHLYLASLKSALQGDLPEAQHLYSEAEKCKEEQGLDFSESAVEEFPFIEEALTTLLSSYDFTRCVRPNGTAYGTGGECKKGAKEDKPKEEKLHKGKNRLEQYILDETLNKLTSDEQKKFKKMTPEQQKTMGTALVKEMAKDPKFWGAVGHTLVSSMFGR